MSSRVALMLAALGLLQGAASAAPPNVERGMTWPEVKCSRYARAWGEAIARRGRQGLGPEFIASHDAFLASGCTARADVCPRSPQEFDLANVMTILAMNAGTASTFLPFACRK